MLTHDPSLSPTSAAQAVLDQFAAHRYADIAPHNQRLTYTLFDDVNNQLAVGFYNRKTGEWASTEHCPTLAELGLLCLEATVEGRSIIVTVQEAKQTGLLDDEIVADNLDLQLDVPRRDEWQGADWRELISDSNCDVVDEDDSDAVSQVSLHDDQDNDDLNDLGPSIPWLGDDS